MNVSTPSRVLIAFGSNVGDSEHAYTHVQRKLTVQGMALIRASKPVQTDAVGGEVGAKQDAYLNAALLVETRLNPEETIAGLMEIEEGLGRVRDRRWGPRTVDLDLLLFGDQEIDLPRLTCPHPRMSFRRFVLEPAFEIAADMIHPVSGCTISELLAQLDDRENLIMWMGEIPAKIRLLNGATTPLGHEIKLMGANVPTPAGNFPADQSVTITQVDSMGQFHRLERHAKLVVLADPLESQDLWTDASRFAGASLRLDDQTLDPCRELVSAIDAMQPARGA